MSSSSQPPLFTSFKNGPKQKQEDFASSNNPTQMNEQAKPEKRMPKSSIKFFQAILIQWTLKNRFPFKSDSRKLLISIISYSFESSSTEKFFYILHIGANSFRKPGGWMRPRRRINLSTLLVLGSRKVLAIDFQRTSVLSSLEGEKCGSEIGQRSKKKRLECLESVRAYANLHHHNTDFRGEFLFDGISRKVISKNLSSFASFPPKRTSKRREWAGKEIEFDESHKMKIQ